MKALEKDRTRRYETANGFARDIQRYLADEPVEAAPPSRATGCGSSSGSTAAQVIAASLVAAGAAGRHRGDDLGLDRGQAAGADRTRRDGRKGKGPTARRRHAAKRGPGDEGSEGAQEQTDVEKAEQLAREDYVNRVNRAYREVQDDNVALAEDLLHGCAAQASRLGVALRRAALQLGTPGPRSRQYECQLAGLQPRRNLGRFRLGCASFRAAHRSGVERRRVGCELRPTAEDPARGQGNRLRRGCQPGRQEGRRRDARPASSWSGTWRRDRARGPGVNRG